MLANLEHQQRVTPTARKKVIAKIGIQAQTRLIEQQKWEIENLKATQATGVSPQQLVNAILQAMSYLYVGNKKTLTNNSSNGDKKFVGTPRPSKPSMGIDGSLDASLTCQYCKDTGHEIDNSKQLQQKLTPE